MTGTQRCPTAAQESRCEAIGTQIDFGYLLNAQDVPAMQIRQNGFALVVSQNQFHIALAKLHFDFFASVIHVKHQISGSIVKRDMNPGLFHDALELSPLSFLRCAFALIWIAIGAFKHAGSHVWALIRQKAGSANGSGNGRSSSFTLVNQVLLLVLKSFKVFVAGMEIAPHAARAKVTNVIAKRVTPGNNMIDALCWFFQAVGAVLSVHRKHTRPGDRAFVRGVSCVFHGWQTFFKRTSPACWVRRSAKTRIAKLAMQLKHRITPNVSWQKEVYHKSASDTNLYTCKQCFTKGIP